jgi:uncharacterized protein YjbI with pentapeptide repeats
MAAPLILRGTTRVPLSPNFSVLFDILHLQKDMSGVSFQQSLVRGSSFVKSKLVAAGFFDADLSNCNFEGANMNQANLEMANLEGSNLKNAIVTEAYISGIDLQQQHPKKIQRGLLAFHSSPR